jgi:hypothetical protein
MTTTALSLTTSCSLLQPCRLSTGLAPSVAGGVEVADLLGDGSLQQPDSRAPARPADSAVERSGATHRVGRVRPNQPAGGLHRPRSRGEGSVQLPAQDNRSAAQPDCDPLRGLHQQSTGHRPTRDLRRPGERGRVPALLLTTRPRRIIQIRMRCAEPGPPEPARNRAVRVDTAQRSELPGEVDALRNALPSSAGRRARALAVLARSPASSTCVSMPCAQSGN